MAERRMLTRKITDNDKFTSLPPTTQLLYFHMCMTADDDGFCDTIRKAMFNAHADVNDLEMLINKRFVIPFDNGVIVIKHWRMHNALRKDRYHETAYVEEKKQLLLKNNGVYSEVVKDDKRLPDWQPNGNQMATEVSIGKDSIDNNILYGDSDGKNSEEIQEIATEIATDAKDDADDFFAKCWQCYPRKKGKGSVKPSQKKRLLNDVGLDQMLRCIERYKQYVAGKDEQYIMYGSTFFNSGYVDYLDENYGEKNDLQKSNEPETHEEPKVGKWNAEWDDDEDDGIVEWMRKNGGK